METTVHHKTNASLSQPSLTRLFHRGGQMGKVVIQNHAVYGQTETVKYAVKGDKEKRQWGFQVTDVCPLGCWYLLSV